MASLCYADYKTTSPQDNEWGFAALRQTKDNRERTTDLRLRCATPDKGPETND